ncbi:MAG: hypothetical protein J6C26_01720 [Clostridia bacterium]|nr:hypothetical protein [Clostridia bacterium]
MTALAQATVLSREEFIRQALRGTIIRQRPQSSAAYRSLCPSASANCGGLLSYR